MWRYLKSEYKMTKLFFNVHTTQQLQLVLPCICLILEYKYKIIEAFAEQSLYVTDQFIQ